MSIFNIFPQQSELRGLSPDKDDKASVAAGAGFRGGGGMFSRFLRAPGWFCGSRRFQGFWDGCWLLGRLQCGRSGVSGVVVPGGSNALVLVWVPVWFLGLVPDGSGNFRAGSSV